MPSSPESVSRGTKHRLRGLALSLALTSCGGGSDVTPPASTTTVSRTEVLLPADTLLVGDSVTASVRALSSTGAQVSPATVIWSTADTSVVSVSSGGVLRARNVGTVRLDVAASGVVGTRSVRVVPRSLRVRLLAPDSASIIDDVQLVSEVETTAGVRLPEVAPRFFSSDTSVVGVTTISVGRAQLALRAAGSTDLLAVIGHDTTHRRLTVRLEDVQSLSVAIEPRVLAIGDSVPFTLTVRRGSAGRSVISAGSTMAVEPAGTMVIRNGHLVAIGAGRVVVRATYGVLLASDTLTAQGPSAFPLEIVDGDGQNPLPLRLLLSMERVAAKWRRAIRSAPEGAPVELEIGECRNKVVVNQFITGVRVLIRLDTLRFSIAGAGGPCVVRANGLPLLGTITLNKFRVPELSDQKLDDLLQHEVGHVLGLGTVWGNGTRAGLVSGDTGSKDPIFVGPAALAAFDRIGGSAQFGGRRVPLELRLLGHWRGDAFAGEVMAPVLSPGAQPTSAVTVAALRDIGWDVETEAYEDYALPEASRTLAGVAPRVAGTTRESLAGDVLLPQIMMTAGGRAVRIDVRGRPLLR